MARTLEDRTVHEGWETVYRTSENERFYELAFDAVAREVAAPPGTRWFDAGCGPGFHAIRLARAVTASRRSTSPSRRWSRPGATSTRPAWPTGWRSAGRTFST